jgi:hypothetical protein
LLSLQTTDNNRPPASLMMVKTGGYRASFPDHINDLRKQNELLPSFGRSFMERERAMHLVDFLFIQYATSSTTTTTTTTQIQSVRGLGGVHLTGAIQHEWLVQIDNQVCTEYLADESPFSLNRPVIPTISQQ